jgi:hypothetical protein
VGIRVTHGQAADIGKLGVEAGRAQGAVRNQALQLQADLAANETQSRFATAKIAANTAIQRSVIDATNRKELAEFESFMRAESERRQIAWQVEKTESIQRHDFEMNIQRKDLENQLIVENDQRKEAEKQVRISALDKAKESGDIGDQEYEEAILSMQVGPEASASLFGGQSLEDLSSFSERGRARTSRKAAIEAAKPENVASRVASLTSEVEQAVVGLDPETRQEAYSLLGRSDITEGALKRMLVDIKDTKDAKRASLDIEKVIEFGFAG